MHDAPTGLSRRVQAIAAALAPADPPDGELLARWHARRDEGAFVELVRRHGRLVWGVCRRATPDADDAYQAVFLLLATRAGRLTGRATVAPWLYRAARRVCQRAGRTAARRRTHEAAAAKPEAVHLPEPADWRPAFDAVLAGLPARYRDAIVLCELGGLPRAMAAERLGVPVGTLASRLAAARVLLRRRLARRGVTAGVLTAAGVPPAVTAGVASATAQQLVRGVTAMTVLKLAAVGAVGLLMVAADGLSLTTAARPADPPAPAAPARPAFTGRWECVLDYSDGSGRHTYALTVLDGQHLERQVTGRASGFVSTVRLRCRYRLTDADLFLTDLEQWVGEEPVSQPPREKAERRYTVKWGAAGGKPWLELKPADSPDARTLRYVPAAPPAPVAVPEVLRGALQPPAREPKYQGKPLYLQLAFGPKAELRVWVVLDGDRVFIDRNANGDLTDDEESPARDLGRAVQPDERRRGGNFLLGLVPDPARHTYYSEMAMTTVTTSPGATTAVLRVRVDGRHDQKAGPEDLFLSPDPMASRVVHFDADRWTLEAPSGSLTRGKTQWVSVRLGTPGAGPGSFAARANFDLPKDKNPVGEYRFPGVAEPVRVVFDRRQASHLGVWDLFKGQVTVPAGAGKGPGKLTLTFPDCPLGAVPPAEYEVWCFPKPTEKE